MKSRFFVLCAAAVLGGMALPETASAQGMWVSSRPLVVALTISYTAPSLPLKDENGKVVPVAEGGGPTFENMFSVVTMNSNGDITKQVDTMEFGGKAVAVKHGNLEVLKELLAEGTLPGIGDKEPAIAGWSLVIISDPEGMEGDTVYARHTTKVMVPLEGIGFGLDEEALAEASTYSSKYIVTTTTHPTTGEPIEKVTSTATGTSKGLGFGMVPGTEGFSGHFTSSAGKTVVKTETIEGEKYVTNVHTPGPRKLDKIAGAVLWGEDAMGAYLEGYMSTPAATAVDMNVYSSDF
jgi:hypothetical protein